MWITTSCILSASFYLHNIVQCGLHKRCLRVFHFPGSLFHLRQYVSRRRWWFPSISVYDVWLRIHCDVTRLFLRLILVKVLRGTLAMDYLLSYHLKTDSSPQWFESINIDDRVIKQSLQVADIALYTNYTTVKCWWRNCWIYRAALGGERKQNLAASSYKFCNLYTPSVDDRERSSS